MDRRNLRTEFAVGAFVLLAVGLTMWLIFETGDLDFASARGYELVTSFENASGLTKGSAVTVAGVIVGEVDDVRLERGRARVRLRIYEGNFVPRGSTTQIGARGLIGEKFVQINPGPPENEPYATGEAIPESAGSSNLDQVLATANDMLGDLREVSRSLRNVLGGPEGEGALREIVSNLRDITGSVNRTLEANDQRIDRIIENVEKLSDTLARISEENRTGLRGTVDNMEALTATLRQELPDLMVNLRQISGNLNRVVGDNTDNMDETLENLRSATGKLDSTLASVGSIAKKIDEGQGTLGKLVSDEETARTF
ncbi:MAG: MCE family protein, partial [Myxococcales bacterium]|nr:MCE family protein [Myxococcales bacterium]